MFTGSINNDARSIVYEMSEQWKDKKVYVGCSGNFTVERILNEREITNIYSNDVSMYSCAIGNYISGKPVEIEIKDQEFDWLKPFMETDLDKIVTLSLCTKVLTFYGKNNIYYDRMFKAHKDNFAKLHEKTKENIGETLDNIKIKEFYAGNVLDFMREAPEDIVAISFPPTYKGGYEKLYEAMEQVFEWEPPEYEIFDNESFKEFSELVMKKGTWVTLRDERVDELEDYLIASTKTSLRSKPVYYYSNQKESKLTLSRQKVQNLYFERISSEDVIDEHSKMQVVKIEQAQMNLLRSQYLSVGILPAPANLNLAVLVDNKLIGAMAFSPETWTSGGGGKAYMMTDFAVNTSQYRRLSKLVLSVAVSKEVNVLIEQALKQKIHSIVTTAFTENAVSMKYRGIFEVYNRKETMVNYQSESSRWTLREGLEWWLKKHSKHLIKN